jgi:DNA polymerase-3 subunit gamma/tau
MTGDSETIEATETASTSDPSEYRVLARKYRPSTFDTLIGQKPMVQTLSNAFDTGRIAQAYMLTGVRGVGKTTTARILARALNYQTDTVDTPQITFDESGVHCLEIMEGRHVDVIEMDAASHTGIDDIREIIASVRYKPTSARYKVYIIDEVHMLSKQAFNGLLKTLEEPPPHVKFIFATTEIRKVPITVLSRCQRFDLRRIEADELSRHLASIADLENVEIEDDALAMIARAAEGSVRDALSLLDQAIAHSPGTIEAAAVRSMLGLADRSRIIDLFDQVMKGDIAAALGELKEQYQSGADPAVVLCDLADFVHYVTRVRFVPEAAEDLSLPQAERERGRQFAESLSPRILGRAWQMLLKGIAEVQSSSRPLAAADMVLVRLTHAADLPTPEEALRKLLDMDAGAANAPSSSTATHPSAGAAAPRIFAASSGARSASANPSLARQSQPATMQTEPQGEPKTPAYEVIDTFDDLLAAAEKKRDIAFKLALRNNVRLVSFQPGRIELSLTDNAPKALVSDLSARLLEWTGKRWMVAISKDGGDASVREQEEAKRSALVEDAGRNPTVAAVLAAFPGSRIVDVRMREVEAIESGEPAESGLISPEDSDDDTLDDYF